MDAISDYVRFNDRKLARRYKTRKIPMTTLYEAYFDRKVDLLTDIDDFLDERDRFVDYSLTFDHLEWAVTDYLPQLLGDSRSRSERLVRERDERGMDFFEWFLGETMVDTSGVFEDPAEESLEDAQHNKMELICQKLQLNPGDTFLDIGCGWGALVRYAAQHYDVEALGVTLSDERAALGNERLQKAGLEDQAELRSIDYRDLPDREFDKIASLERVEHVGVRNLSDYYEGIFDLLADDGLFFLQWTGLRRDLRWEDLVWGLFASKYAVPGVASSSCLNSMTQQMEKANFEVHSVENVTNHYGLTLERWHDNWRANKDRVLAEYGERWYRIWNFFLAWSQRIAEQGNAACFQSVMYKNLDSFDRRRWIGSDQSVSLAERAHGLRRAAE